jgi:hypothetical protein
MSLKRLQGCSPWSYSARIKYPWDGPLNCQTPLAAFMEFAAKHGVPPIRYDASDVEEDHSTREQLGA